MAKKDNAPAISLFSFQDIITSLTGIMFLVVLLLIIFMLDLRPKTEDDTDKKDSAEPVTMQQLNELKSKIELFRNQKIKMQERLDELKKLDLEHIQSRISNLRSITQEQASVKSLLEQKINELNNQLINDKMEAENVKKEILKLTAENQKMDQRIKIKEEILKSSHAQTLFVKKAKNYTIENASSSSPILVECEKDGIRILDISTGESLDLRQANGTFDSRKNKFLKWIQKRDIKNEYYTILIKPESFEYGVLIDDLKSVFPGKESTIERGLEILPQNELSIFGEE